MEMKILEERIFNKKGLRIEVSLFLVASFSNYMLFFANSFDHDDDDENKNKSTIILLKKRRLINFIFKLRNNNLSAKFVFENEMNSSLLNVTILASAFVQLNENTMYNKINKPFFIQFNNTKVLHVLWCIKF